MKNNLIGISGKLGSGKDTVGKILQYLSAQIKLKSDYSHIKDVDFDHNLIDVLNGLSLYNYDSAFKIKKFADKLKDIVCLLIGCTREQLEDREFKEKELGEEWWYYDLYKEHFPYIKTKSENPDSWHERVKDRVVKLTPRKLLQLLGTEAGREIIHPNIWVNALFADYRGVIDERANISNWQSKWIITDVRFPNEVQSIKDNSGHVYWMKRAVFEDTHASEVTLLPENYDHDNFDGTLINEGKGKTLNALSKSVEKLYKALRTKSYKK